MIRFTSGEIHALVADQRGQFSALVHGVRCQMKGYAHLQER